MSETSDNIINGLQETSNVRCTSSSVKKLVIPSSSVRGSQAKFENLTKYQQLAEDPELYFNNNLSSDSGVLDIPNWSFESLLWTVGHDCRSLRLNPVSFNNNEITQSLLIELPGEIRDNCHGFNVDELKCLIVIDLITVSGIFVTLQFNYTKDFHTSELGSVESWCYFSTPYNFEIREPHYVHSISTRKLLVFFKDGGIIYGERDEFNSDLRMSIFSDTSFISSTFGKFGKYLPLKYSAAYDEDESNYNLPSGCTLKTNLDSFVINEEILVTISLNRKLKVWSISSGSLIAEEKFDEKTAELTDKLVGDGRPISLLSALFQDKSKNVNQKLSEYYFFSYLPVGTGQFKLWKLSLDNQVKIHDLGPQFEYLPVIPETSSIWLVKDFKLVTESILKVDTKFYGQKQPWLNVVVLLKSNTSSVYQLLTIFKDGLSSWIKSNLGTQILADTHPSRFPYDNSQGDSEFYIEKIVDSGLYSEFTIETALALFERKYFGEENSAIPIDLPYKEKLPILLSRIAQSPDQVAKQWRNFESLCLEFTKLENESLSLNYLKSNHVIVGKKVGYSILRTSEDVELLYFNRQTLVRELPLFSTPGLPEFEFKKSCGITSDSDMLKFLNVISTFKYSIPTEVLISIRTLLLDPVRGSVIRYSQNIFDSCLAGKISESTLQTLMLELNSISDAFKTIGYFLEYPRSVLNKFVYQKTDIEQGQLRKDFDISSFKQLLIIFDDIYFNLLLITFILNFSEETTVVILNSAISIYKNIQVGFLALSVDLAGRSLFDVIVSKEVNFNLDGAIRGLFLVINDEKFFYAATNELLKANKGDLVRNKFLGLGSKTVTSPINKLLEAYTYLVTGVPNKSRNKFAEIADEVTSYLATSQELEVIDQVSGLIQTTTLLEYYLELAILFSEYNYYTDALKLIKVGVKESNVSSKPVKQQYYLTLFDVALALQNFDEAFAALLEVSKIQSGGSQVAGQARYKALKGFVNGISSSNDLKNLTTYTFSTGDSATIDQILFNNGNTIDFNFKASTSIGVINQRLDTGLRYFKILYSWRLNQGNIRGACESLYQYINKYDYLLNHPDKGGSVVDLQHAKFRPLASKQSNIIPQLYLIIANVLLSLKNKNERWIRAQNLQYIYGGSGIIENEYEIIKLDELSEHLH